MLRKCLTVLFIIVPLSLVSAQESALHVSSPKDGATVPERPFVKGTVHDPKANVWVIVHPMEVSDYYIQPAVSVRENGTWKVIIYVGRPGEVDVGKYFEIMAVANPRQELREGMVLGDWPTAERRSQLVEVIRK